MNPESIPEYLQGSLFFYEIRSVFKALLLTGRDESGDIPFVVISEVFGCISGP